MNIDVELYRRDVRINVQPRLRLSVIDISPEYPRQVLVFIHGFGGSAVQWQHQLNHFSVLSRVIAPDLRGHGLSDKPNSAYSMAEIQDDLEILLYGLGINQPIVLIGHSFGGAVAATYAVAHPRRVKSLVLIASAVRYRLSTLYRTALRLPLPVLRLGEPLLRNQVQAPLSVLKAWYINNLSTWDGQEVYQSLSMPALVIRGYQDRLFEMPAYDQVAQLVPNAEEIDVGASGHMVMLERKEAVNRAIRRFIETDDTAQMTPISTQEDEQREALLRERPWLHRYDPQTPFTIALPRVPVQNLLSSSARRFPKQTAIIFKGREISYQKLLGEVDRFANALKTLGIKKGERVILALPNLPQLVIGYYGVLQAGAVAVFARPSASAEELVDILRDSGACVLMTLTQYDELIQQVRLQCVPGSGTNLQHVIFTHIADYLPLSDRLQIQISPTERKRHLLDIPLDASIHIFTDLLRKQSIDSLEIEITPNDLAAIIYTGGTTSRPKGVMLSHRNLLANALQTRHWLPNANEGEEKVLCAVPISHSYGLTACLNVPIALGAAIILEPEFELTNVLEDIARHRPTIFPGVPQMFLAVMNVPGVWKYGLSTIRINISGSDPLSLEVMESYEKITHAHLTEGYGLTEASPITHINPLSGLQKPGSIGVPIPSTEARLVDLRRADRPAPAGQVGELAVRGPQVMLGYWQDSKGTARVLSKDGWLLTGDVAQMDSEGYFRIIARKDDMWYPDRPDRPISPRAIEEVLQEIPQVKEAAVVAIAGRPVAFVIARDKRPSADSLIAYCKRRLPRELVPRLVVFVDEFPRSFVGKILRQELAKRLDEKKRLDEPGTVPLTSDERL
ncbi:MAG: AMP-dependent synthetase and ligase [Chloroflexi bacterium]|nr:AMP-dependent synthetase and ligase [Chloroflexota bacterium]